MVCTKDLINHILTAEQLFQAYKSCNTDKEAESLLENIEVEISSFFFFSSVQQLVRVVVH